MEPQISLSNPGSQTSGICECEFDKVQLPSDKPFQSLQKALNLFLKNTSRQTSWKPKLTQGYNTDSLV